PNAPLLMRTEGIPPGFPHRGQMVITEDWTRVIAGNDQYVVFFGKGTRESYFLVPTEEIKIANNYADSAPLHPGSYLSNFLEEFYGQLGSFALGYAMIERYKPTRRPSDGAL